MIAAAQLRPVLQRVASHLPGRHEASSAEPGETFSTATAQPGLMPRLQRKVMSHPALAPLTTHGNHVNGLDVSAPLLPPPVALALNGRPAQRFSQILDQAPAYRYKQSGYQLVDAYGDASLIKRLGGEPALLVGQLGGKLKPHDKAAPARPQDPDYKVYKEPSMDVDALTHQFIDDIQDSPYPPTIGEEHKWSPEAKAYLKGGALREMGRFVQGKDSLPIPLMGRSKLFYMLANGRTSLYAVTGQENALNDWAVAHKDRSIQPHDLLRESYRLNEGDLYKTLMTCENVLNVDWTDPHRSEQPIQSKLAYIRNDSKPTGDNYGAWYHFMGMAVYSLMRSEGVSKAVVNTEAVGSYILGGPDPQEDEMGRIGVQFGSRLKSMVGDGSWQMKAPPGARTDYLHTPHLQS